MSTQHSTDYGYYVQVRSTHILREPAQVGGTWVARQWQRVSWPPRPFNPATNAVSVTAPSVNPVASQQKIMSYAHAHAMVAGTIASHALCGMFLEFRLEKVKIVYDWEITTEGIGPVIDMSKNERDDEFKEES